MRDYIDIGSSPAEEDCAQVGSPDYYKRAKTECARFIALIRKVLGPEPDGAHLAVKSFPHDWGTYHEVVCHFDDQDEEAVKYALLCESEAPRTWQDDQPKAPAGSPGEVLQCADCNLVTADQERAARGAPCYRCGGTDLKVKAEAPPAEKAKQHRRVGVCDSCLTTAYDNGIRGRAEQAEAMMLLGADIEDHNCDQVEARDLGIKCACACRRR